MSDYTPEQIEPDDVVTAAARVLCAYESRECNVDKDDNWNLYAEDFKAQARPVVEAVAPLLRAPVDSAAQNTQGEDKPFAWYRVVEPGGVAVQANCPVEWEGTAIPLYTHAERATVTNGLVLVPREMVAEAVQVLRNVDTQFRATGQPSARIERAIDALSPLAAAPSQPEDAQS